MDSPIRVVLADDHPLVRAGIRATLVAEGDFALVGEATNGDEVHQMCCELQPDILLLDIHMPGSPVVQTVAYLCQQYPGIKILILTAYDYDTYVRGLISAGAVGYILKDEAPQTVVRAIRAVLQGDTWYSQSIVKKLARWQATEAAAATEASLNPREVEILKMLAQGRDNARIAEELHLAEQTVRNRVSRIYTKIGVSSRAEAIVWAREKGLA